VPEAESNQRGRVFAAQNASLDCTRCATISEDSRPPLTAFEAAGPHFDW